MTVSEEPQDAVLQWIDLAATPVEAANVAVLQQDGGESASFFLSFGFVQAPLLLDTVEERNDPITLPVRTVARVQLSETRLRELHELLSRTLKRHDDHTDEEGRGRER